MSDLGYVRLDVSTLRRAEEWAYRERQAQSEIVRHAEVESAAARARRLGRQIRAHWRAQV